MSRTLKGVVLLVVCVGMLVGASSAFALTRPETLNLLEVTGVEGEINIPPAGFGAGDGFTFSDPLYRWAGAKRGARVGRVDGHCTFTQVDFGPPETATSYCVATVFLPAGQVVVAKHLRFAGEGPQTFSIAVVGGTGRYSNARGQATIRDIGTEGNSAVTLRLVP
jgi:hypothetical protein